MARKNSRSFQYANLYADGTLVEWFKESNAAGVESGDTLDVTLGFAKVHMKARTWSAETADIGAISIGEYQRGILAVLRGNRVEVTPCTIGAGSPNSQRLGVAIGHVEVKTKHGSITWLVTEDFIGCGLTIMPDAKYKKPTRAEDNQPIEPYVGGYLTYEWDARINKLTDLRPKPEVFAEVTA